MDNDSLYIIIPAYNEMENIENVINEWYEVIEKHQTQDNKSRLVIINDGSKDDTLKIAQKVAEGKEYCIVLNKENSGHASTCMFGYRYAIEQGADYIFQTDSDGQTRADEFDDFWQTRKDNVVMGFRKSRGDGFSRLFISRTLRFVNILFFHVYVKDSNVPYRLMSNSALKKAIEIIPNDYNLGNVILTVAFEKLGYKIKWLPITFAPRAGGVSMYNVSKFIKIGINAIKEFRGINKVLNNKLK